ncbi:MAG: BON domain-containing protein [Thermoanaerobaculia bacterium]
MRGNVSRAFGVVLLFLVTACAGNVNPTRQIDDAVLASNVRQAFESDGELRPLNIVIDAHSGIVTLSGSVPTSRLRDRAASTARSVPGVVDVVNQLTVP